MLEVPGRRDFSREAHHVSLERDVDEDRVVLVLYLFEQLCHNRSHRLARALPELWTQLDFGHRLPADPVRVAEMCIERAGALRRRGGNRANDSYEAADSGSVDGGESGASA